MPLRIDLVNMPFASLARPSLALTQLKEITQRAHGEQVAVKVCYLSHDFGKWLDESIYSYASDSVVALSTGLGEWFFRLSAFPELADNREEFWARFGHHFDADGTRWFNDVLLPKRSEIPQFLDTLIERYELAQADVVGLTSMFWQNLACVSLANRLRIVNPKQVIVIGGANCEAEMGVEVASNFPIFDYVFSGPSLISFPKLIESLLADRRADCAALPGVFTHEAANARKDAASLAPTDARKGAALIGPELDINTPFELDYDDFFASYERNVSAARGFAKKVEIFFETSRGCWWGERAHCTFCGLNGVTMAYRAMHPALAQQIIERLVMKYGERYSGRLLLMSVDNILPREYLSTLLERLKLPETISIFYEVKADLTDDQVQTLSRSGVRFIQPGIESMATSTLKLMRKGTTSFSNIRFLMSCQKHAVRAYWNLLVGSPGETEETYNMYYRQLPLLYHLQPPMGVFQIRFDRFSPYYSTPEKYGIKLRPYDFYSLIYPFPEDAITRLGYYFENANADAQYFVDLASAQNRLKLIVNRWQARWRGSSDTVPRLQLRRAGTRLVVLDSRRGATLNVPLSQAELEVLEAAQHASDEAALRAAHGDAFASALRKGFLFTERARVMNLVEGVHGDSVENVVTEAGPQRVAV